MKQYASRSIEYGENRDGYWISERFLEQLKDCALIAECKYPREQGYKVVWVFDHSSCYGAYADDALIVSRMNGKPGGKQLLLHDTIWNCKVQKMVLAKGLIKY